MNFSHIELPSNRKFGCFFTAVFSIATVYSYYVDSTIWFYISGTVSVVFLSATITKADVLLPLNQLWMKFGLLLGMIVSPIVMGVIFFVVFTPIAVLMRFFGRDELRLRFKKKSTHWVSRDIETQSESFKHQF